MARLEKTDPPRPPRPPSVDGRPPSSRKDGPIPAPHIRTEGDRRPMDPIARSLYFGIQRLRGGVSPDHVQSLQQLLDSDPDVFTEHVKRRLKATHGARGDPVGWLRLQDVMERADVTDPAWSRGWLRRFRRLERKKTSGSTGQPVRICKDMEMAAWIDATMWALYAWHGIEPGMPHARFWGLPPRGWSRKQRRVVDWALRRRRLDAFEHSDQAIRGFFEKLRRFRPVYLHGLPSLIDEFVRVCERDRLEGTDLGVRVIFLTGEILDPAVRNRIADFFGARVVNEYGCSESGLLVFECERGGSHEIPGAAMMELVDANGCPVDEHETGEVLVTDLFGRHRPLLRYRLGDHAIALPEGGCACGRSLPMIDITAGRSDAFIILPSGERVLCAVLSYTMPEGIRRFQARQVSPERLSVVVEPANGGAPGNAVRECQERLHRALRGQLVVEVEAGRIPRGNNGKHRYFVPLRDEGR